MEEVSKPMVQPDADPSGAGDESMGAESNERENYAAEAPAVD